MLNLIRVSFCLALVLVVAGSVVVSPAGGSVGNARSSAHSSTIFKKEKFRRAGLDLDQKGKFGSSHKLNLEILEILPALLQSPRR